MQNNRHLYRARMALTDEERQQLDRQVEILIAAVKSRPTVTGPTRLNFGRSSALELLAKVGIWLNENEGRLP